MSIVFGSIFQEPRKRFVRIRFHLCEHVANIAAQRQFMKLRQIAENAQVLCVTHSAQIASLAKTHWYIAKTETDGRMQTTIRPLDEAERVEEIARILGGIEVTEAQRRAAVEMIEEGRVL